MRPPARVLTVLLVGAALFGGRAAAQSRGPAGSSVAGAGLGTAVAAPGGQGDLSFQHTFPLAGGRLLVVVEGLLPAEVVLLQLSEASRAAPSVMHYLVDQTSPQMFRAGDPAQAVNDTLSCWFTADERGRVVLDMPLGDPADVDRDINLQAVQSTGGRTDLLKLHVQPPMIVLPGPSGLQRISLLSGAVLQPAIPGAGGLRGLALSDTGTLGYALRDGGRLEILSAHEWGAPPLAVHALDPAADILATRTGGGAAFVLSRPGGEPFTPAGSLLFLQDEHRPLVLEPMGQPVSGRRVALTDDGLTAFVAEDDLIVREVDLQTGRARGLITAGLAGDSAISDVVMEGRRLLVATRGPHGRQGALTVFDLDRNTIDTLAMRVDPLRLVTLGHGLVLIVPAAGGVFQMVENGVPSRLFAAPGIASWLDAAPSGDGALLLGAFADGRRSLLHLQALTGVFSARLDNVPPARRLASTGSGPAVLLGDPGGAVHVFDPATGAVTTLGNVIAAPDAAFVVLP